MMTTGVVMMLSQWCCCHGDHSLLPASLKSLAVDLHVTFSHDETQTHTHTHGGDFYFAFPADVRWKNKFWGKSMEIVPMGTTHVTLPA